MNQDPSRGKPPPFPLDGTLHFFEQSGPEARASLTRLAQQRRQAGGQAGLWRSLDQQDVWLLIAKGDGPTPPAADGLRHWRFEAES